VILVVGGAIVRHGTVLAARRTSPSEAAGRWELPGGKVDPGESPESALVREIREELGCRIAVDSWLDGEQPIGPAHTLRGAVCRLQAGEPVVGPDHDQLRWLPPEELEDLDWLEPDRPFLVELREVLLDGEPLPGGNVGGAVRIGETVRRPTGPWTPTVHALLGHLDTAGLRAVPGVRGFDARGREVLDYLPGEIVDVDIELLSEPRLADLGRWAREFHDAVRGFGHPGPWRFFDVPGATTICHNDLAPYNVCFAGDEVSGVFDWDLAGPSTRQFELAQLAWTGVPLFRPIPDRTADARVRLIAAAYGGVSPAEILDAVVPLKRIGMEGIRDWIATGDPAGAAQAAIGEPDRTAAQLDEFQIRLPRIGAARAQP
jgi:mutator protein MutT